VNKVLIAFFDFVKIIQSKFEGKVQYEISYKFASGEEIEAGVKEDFETKMTMTIKNGINC